MIRRFATHQHVQVNSMAGTYFAGKVGIIKRFLNGSSYPFNGMDYEVQFTNQATAWFRDYELDTAILCGFQHLAENDEEDIHGSRVARFFRRATSVFEVVKTAPIVGSLDEAIYMAGGEAALIRLINRELRVQHILRFRAGVR